MKNKSEKQSISRDSGLSHVTVRASEFSASQQRKQQDSTPLTQQWYLILVLTPPAVNEGTFFSDSLTKRLPPFSVCLAGWLTASHHFQGSDRIQGPWQLGGGKTG